MQGLTNQLLTMKSKILLLTLLSFLFFHGQAQNNNFLFHQELLFHNPASISTIEYIQLSANLYTQPYDETLNDESLAILLPIKKINSVFGVSYDRFRYQHPFDSFEGRTMQDMSIYYSYKHNFKSNWSLAFGAELSLHKMHLSEKTKLFDIEGNHIYIDRDLSLNDLDIGIWLTHKQFQLGLTNRHVNSASDLIIDNAGSVYEDYKLLNELNAILMYELHFGQNRIINNYLMIQGLASSEEHIVLLMNNSYKLNKSISLGVSTRYDIRPNQLGGLVLSPTFAYHPGKKLSIYLAAIPWWDSYHKYKITSPWIHLSATYTFIPKQPKTTEANSNE